MRYAAAFLLICSGALAQGTGDNPSAPMVTVDFGKPASVLSQSGLQAGVDASNPPYGMVAPLRPALWGLSGLFPYNDPAPPAVGYGRAKQFTNRLLLTLSDFWGYPTTNPPPGEYPYSDWPKWQTLVQQCAQANAGRGLLWSVWNEPDNPTAWPGTQQQYFDTYARAYTVLRQVLGSNAAIGGPGIATYNKAYLAAFLDYSLANGLQVNFLSWHELATGDTGVAAIAANLQDARASFLLNPKYAALNIQKIFIDRAVGVTGNHKPGDVLGFLYYLEQGQADGAAKACWPDSRQTSECFNNTLDGLLTTQQQPRSAWWAYKTYADGVSTRVTSTTTDYRVVALASTQGVSAATAQVLVGYFNSAGTAAIGVPVTLTLNNLSALPFLQGATQVHLVLELMPAADEAPIAQMTSAGDFLVPIQAGSAQVAMGTIRPGEAYRVTVAAPAGGAAPVAGGIVNGASFKANQAVAPGSLVAIFGTGLSPVQASISAAPWPTATGGVTVTVNDIALPLFYVSATQINAQLPYATMPGNATLVVRSGGNVSAALPFLVVPAAPGIFLLPGNHAAAQNQDGSVNSTIKHAPAGSYVTVYLTGQGTVDNPVADGVGAPVSPLANATLPMTATIGGTTVPIQFLGLTPGYAGLAQANLLILNIPGGELLLTITIGGVESNAALISVD